MVLFRPLGITPAVKETTTITRKRVVVLSGTIGKDTIETRENNRDVRA